MRGIRPLFGLMAGAMMAGIAASPAQADPPWRRGYYYGPQRPVYVAPRPYYVAPPRVYYAPPRPVYVAPPPVYYAPPVYAAPPPVYYAAPRPGIGLYFGF